MRYLFSVSGLSLSYNVCLHAGLCLSINNGKDLDVPKSARIHRSSTSSGEFTHIGRIFIEVNSSKESSFTEVNHSENQQKQNRSFEK